MLASALMADELIEAFRRNKLVKLMAAASP
jgi:hypothetical protein